MRKATSDIRQIISRRKKIINTLKGLKFVRQHLRQQTISAAIGDISEQIAYAYLQSKKFNVKLLKHNEKGIDLRICKEGVQVKARLFDSTNKRWTFDFRNNCENAQYAICMAWDVDKYNNIVFVEAYDMQMDLLIKNFEPNNRRDYCARTTLAGLNKLYRKLDRLGQAA
jgi:hypothetical protein